MNSTMKSILTAATLLGASAFSSAAMAAACTGVSIGSSSTADVKLGGGASDKCVVSTVNPQNGSTAGFSAAFGAGSWSLLSKVTGTSVAEAHTTANFGGVGYKIDFTENSGTEKTGTWTITADKAVTLDLAFALHASNRSDAFFFDDQVLAKNAATAGSWTINWRNNGGQVPNFSNLTIFARDSHISAVPEADTYAMLLAGLGLVGFVARRRRAK
ncbi:PEP-CTERM sorting domain-containing protein [Rugamonas sp. DEMB1]|uniref:PEP-CTERM sorting domain-containing protein n=1 Tax=Rugamonas sp. DEMB1 TaxID=3039386 RepID=UPI00244C368F|nr:PEP-CTERM sorting domain-containing protein [Rugamonas sp. DEMB1]WGG49078.1 PEP-CTERM sorting domain-containing protein [Rugamonas sp. DEMB1]